MKTRLARVIHAAQTRLQGRHGLDELFLSGFLGSVGRGGLVIRRLFNLLGLTLRLLCLVLYRLLGGLGLGSFLGNLVAQGLGIGGGLLLGGAGLCLYLTW